MNRERLNAVFLTSLLPPQLLPHQRRRLGADQHVHGLDIRLELPDRRPGLAQAVGVGVLIGGVRHLVFHLVKSGQGV